MEINTDPKVIVMDAAIARELALACRNKKVLRHLAKFNKSVKEACREVRDEERALFEKNKAEARYWINNHLGEVVYKRYKIGKVDVFTKAKVLGRVVQVLGECNLKYTTGVKTWVKLRNLDNGKTTFNAYGKNIVKDLPEGYVFHTVGDLAGCWGPATYSTAKLTRKQRDQISLL